MSESRLRRMVRGVVSNDNCTGCGGCALLTSRIQMRSDEEGFLRPDVDDSADRADDRRLAREFARMCPGRRVVNRPPSNAEFDPTVGYYLEAWQASAVDPVVRAAGSSGGVLTALSTWLLESRRVAAVSACAQSADEPLVTERVEVRSPEAALEAAGSRYAPVSLSRILPLLESGEPAATVCKPCEATGLKQFQDGRDVGLADRPPILSFFCAGTPSQRATEGLVTLLEAAPDDVAALRYRGDGWPGLFSVTTSAGERRTMSYEESWGGHLGRQLQTRCKLCPDGTGNHADIAVGDFWEADARGFPVFDEGDGNSVLLVRTERGRRLLRAAVEDGIVAVAPVDISSVSRVQPLQEKRMRELGGRLIGRLLAGRRIPHYSGYGILRSSCSAPLRTMRAAAGTWTRALKRGGRA